MGRLQKKMDEKRPLIAPFFKDFDRGLGNLGRVTPSHFSRLLGMMKMDVSEPELIILVKKYEDKEQGLINYIEFVRDVDPQ
ncbi:hypothetical protein HK102_009416, partial [Quaeritorhiza haematococci]